MLCWLAGLQEKMLWSDRAAISPAERWSMADKKKTSSRKEEARSFAFLTIVMAPVLAGILIAAYGFIVWFYQMFSGPPHA